MKTYNEANVKRIKGLYEAASHGDFGPLREALDPNVEWLEPTVPGLWFSGTHRGADAVWKEVISPTAERLEEFRVKPKRFYAVGDHVMVIGYFHGRGKATGRELEAATIHVCTLRNGKIVRFEAFHDPAQWLETLGVAQSEPQRMAA